MLFKVGELAKRTGLTVRTLHHYDDIGLLKPSARSEAGYRLYNNADIARLHGIQTLRNLGLGLSDIDSMLAVNGATMPEILSRQLNALDQEITRATDLRARLDMLKNGLLVGIEPDADDWLAALDLMATHGKYFTTAELKSISESWKEIENEWQPLIKDIRAAMQKNMAADAPVTQILARRWMDLSMRWMKDDVDLLKRWKEMCKKDPVAYGKSGIDGELFQYIGRAIELRMIVLQKYLNLDELKRLNKNLDAQWKQLDISGKKILRQKLSLDSEAAQQLVVQWGELLDEATDHDSVIRQKLLHAFSSEPLLQSSGHLSRDVSDFIRRGFILNQT